MDLKTCIYHTRNFLKNCQKLHMVAQSKSNYILLNNNGGKIVQFEFGEYVKDYFY